MTDSSSLIHIVQKSSRMRFTIWRPKSMVAVSFEEPGVYGQLRRARGSCVCWRRFAPWPGKKDEVLPGQHSELYGLVRETPANGDYAVLIRVAVWRCQAFTATGSSSITARRTACSRATGSCSIMNPPCAARPSSPQNHSSRGRASRLACRRALISGNLDAARLGPCAHYVENAMADAAAGKAGGLRHRNGRQIACASSVSALRCPARTRPDVAGNGSQREGGR